MDQQPTPLESTTVYTSTLSSAIDATLPVLETELPCFDSGLSLLFLAFDYALMNELL